MRKSTKRQSYISDEKIRHICASVIGVDLLKEPEWNGAGLPPVGAECEVNDVDQGWISATVIGHDDTKGVAVCKTVYGYDGYEELRPLCTQAQRERDDLLTSVVEDYRKSLHRPVSTVEINLILEFANYLFEIGMLREAGE